jgi:hypothetical protein
MVRWRRLGKIGEGVETFHVFLAYNNTEAKRRPEREPAAEEENDHEVS